MWRVGREKPLQQLRLNEYFSVTPRVHGALKLNAGRVLIEKERERERV